MSGPHRHKCTNQQLLLAIGNPITSLYLNVWRPAFGNTSHEQLPVMLWIHGGSWDTGSAMLTNLYDGERLAAVGRVIVVAANYRLNAFGYLGSSALRAEDSSTGNWGTQDQRAAMKWIHDNAQSLGADVSRLMIFGESAGAMFSPLISPKASM